MAEKMTYGEFMRLCRIRAIKSGQVKEAYPGELAQHEEMAKQLAEGRDAGREPEEIGFVMPRDASAKEAAKAIQDMIVRDDKDQSDSREENG